jgi:predicted transposase YdaD
LIAPPAGLYLIRQTESEAPATARNLIARARAEIGDEALRADLIELIERVIIYKLSRFTREEIQAMLQIHDIRESRVYQEAIEEGEKKGMEKGIEKGAAIVRLAARKKSVAEIAAVLEVDVELVRQVLAQAERD